MSKRGYALWIGRRTKLKLYSNFADLGSGIIGLGYILWLMSSLASGFGGMGIMNV